MTGGEGIVGWRGDKERGACDSRRPRGVVVRAHTVDKGLKYPVAEDNAHKQCRAHNAAGLARLFEAQKQGGKGYPEPACVGKVGYDAEKAVKKRVVKMLVYVVEYRIVKAVYCVHVFCPFWICT